MGLQIEFKALHVPLNKRKTVKPLLLYVLRSMNLTRPVMQNLRFWETLDQRYKAALREDPLTIIENGVMNSFINGNDMNGFKSLGKERMMIQSLKKENDSFWQEVVQSFMTRDEMVILYGKPNKNLLKEKRDEAKQHIENRNRQLGKEGLTEKAKLLKEAKLLNSQLYIPQDLFTQFPIPSVSSIFSNTVTTILTGKIDLDLGSSMAGDKDMMTKNGDELNSYNLRASCFDSREDFDRVFIQVSLDSSQLDEDLKKYLIMYLRAIYDSRRWYDNDIIPLAVPFYNDIASFAYSVKKDNFKDGLNVLKAILSNNQDFHSSIRSFLSKAAQYQERNQETHMLMLMMIPKLWPDQVFNEPFLSVFDKKLIAIIESDSWNNDGNNTLRKLEEIHAFVTNPKRVVLHITSNLEFISKIQVSFQNINVKAVLHDNLRAQRRKNDKSPMSLLTSDTTLDKLQPSHPGIPRVIIVVFGEGWTHWNWRWTSEEGFDMFFAEDLIHIDQDSAIELVTDKFMMMLHSSLVNDHQSYKIDGYGSFATFYSTHLVESKMGFLVKHYGAFVQQATVLQQSFKEMKNFVDVLSEKYLPFDMLLELVKRQLVFDLTANVQPKWIVQSAMESWVDGRPSKYDKEFMQGILNATTADVAKLLQERLEPFFKASGNAQIIVFTRNDTEKIVMDFQQMGYEVETMEADELIGFEEKQFGKK